MHLGLWFIHEYTLRLILGTLVGLIWLHWEAPRYQFNRGQLPILIATVTLGALVGGRIGYVGENGTYFSHYPAAAIQPWRVGGLSAEGVWIGSLIALAAWAAYSRCSFAATLSFLAPAALFISAGVWWGCAALGCGWGKAALLLPDWLQWAVVEAPDLYSLVLPRYAVQNLEVVWSLILALFALLCRRCGLLALSLYMGGTALLALLRDDPAPLIGTYRWDQLLFLALAFMFWFLQWQVVKDGYQPITS